MFTIPYYHPGFNPGLQVVNLGTGGPASHMALRAMAPRSYPTLYDVGNKGMGGAMPRQVLGPSTPTYTNAWSQPITQNNLAISGLFKSPFGG